MGTGGLRRGRPHAHGRLAGALLLESACRPRGAWALGTEPGGRAVLLSRCRRGPIPPARGGARLVVAGLGGCGRGRDGGGARRSRRGSWAGLRRGSGAAAAGAATRRGGLLAGDGVSQRGSARRPLRNPPGGSAPWAASASCGLAYLSSLSEGVRLHCPSLVIDVLRLVASLQARPARYRGSHSRRHDPCHRARCSPVSPSSAMACVGLEPDAR